MPSALVLQQLIGFGNRAAELPRRFRWLVLPQLDDAEQQRQPGPVRRVVVATGGHGGLLCGRQIADEQADPPQATTSPAPPDNRHDPGVVSPEEVADQLGLHVPVLEVARRDDRRRVHELGPGGSGRRPFGLALPLKPGGDALLGAPGRRPGVGQQPLLGGDPRSQFPDVLLDPRSPRRVGPRQFPFGLGQLTP